MLGYALDWIHEGESATPCPVCGAAGSPHVAIMRQEGTFFSHLARCRQCGTIFYENPHLLGYLTAELPVMTSKKFYVELAVGIEGILAPLLAMPGAEGKSLLDIGCGFGFALDFWNKFMHGRSLGLEQVGYGQDGKECFGLDIRQEYLTAENHGAFGAFDIVYACEVIEHVEDPQQFIRDAASALSPDGIFCFTTPNAEYIRPENNANIILQSLAPNLHIFLLSMQAIERMLKKAGFPHIRFADAGPRLFVWASHAPLDALKWGTNSGLGKKYMETLRACPDPHVRGGVLYRQLSASVSAGNFGEALRLRELLRQCVADTYHFDLYEPGSYLNDVLSLDDPSFFRKIPCYLGPALFYLGLIYGHQGNKKRFLAFLDHAEGVLRKSPFLCAEIDEVLAQCGVLKTQYGPAPRSRRRAPKL